MEILPQELNDMILEEINDYDTMYIIVRINHYWYDKLIDKFKIKLSWLNEFKKRKYPVYVINLFSGLKEMAELPVLPYKGEFSGTTGYIDRIKVSDVPYPIMTGIDNSNKLFITFKLKIKTFDIESIESEEVEHVITYHERSLLYYSWIFQSISLTSFGMSLMFVVLFEKCHCLSFDKLKKIITGESIINENCEIMLA